MTRPGKWDLDIGKVDAWDMLDRLGIRNMKEASGGREILFSCPFPGHSHGDQHPSAYMNVETTAWFCQGCKRRGNAIHFVAEHQNISNLIAARWLRERYGTSFREPDGTMQEEIDAIFRSQEDEESRFRPPSNSWLETFKVNWRTVPMAQWHHYIVDRGFSLDTLNEWMVGYDEVISKRLTIPVFDVEGNLVGFKGRSWDGSKPKYLALGDLPERNSRYGFDVYNPAEHIFGLHRRRDHRRVVLCEGELDAIALHQYGVIRPAAVGMSYLSDRARELLVQEADEVVVFFDTDLGGSLGALEVVRRLEPFITVKLVPDHEDDPAGMGQQRALELVGKARSSVEVLPRLGSSS